MVIWTACKRTHNQHETNCGFQPHPRECLCASGSIINLSILPDYQYQYIEVIINHPYTETWQRHLTRNFLSAHITSLPSRKSHGNYASTNYQHYLFPAPDQHGFRPENSTTSVLLQLTTDITMGFNQMNLPDRTVCVAVDLSAAFDTTCCRRSTDRSTSRPQRDGYPAT